EKYNIEVKVCGRPEEVYKGAHILAALTDSAVEVTDGSLLEKGTHIVVVGGTGKPDGESLKRVDVYLRFGDTPAPVGHPELATDAEHVGYEARPAQARQHAAGSPCDPRRSRVGKSPRPHVVGTDHLLRARQSAGRAVSRGGGESLRAGEAGRRGARDPHRVVSAGHPRLKHCNSTNLPIETVQQPLLLALA